MSAPKHVCDELLKLNEVKFHGSQIKNQPVVVNKNIEKQSSLQNLPLVPDKRNYCKAAQPRLSPYNTLIFTNSIPKGIRMYEFNPFLRNRKAKMLNFPGPSCKRMLHYIDIHLED